MKYIQSILMILLAVTLIGMMPNLADAELKTIIISPDKFVPTTAATNYVRYPNYVSSRDNQIVEFWAKIKFPNNANRLENLIYYHSSFNQSTTVQIYRSKVGQANLDLISGITGFDNSGNIIKLQKDIFGSPKVDNNWIYWVYVVCTDQSANVHGVKIKVSTR